MRLHRLADGIWSLDGNPVSFLTFPYEIRSTIIELGGGELFIHSPVQLSAATLLKALPGQVKYIVSPNKLHSLFLADWKKAFPDAKLYAPPGLKARLPDLSFYKDLADMPEPEWQEILKQKVVRGSWFMSEVVFFHKPSETLILGDLIENHNPQNLGWLHRAIGLAMGMLAPNGSTARIYRWTFFRRKEVHQDLQEILSWNAQRVIVNHGPIVEIGAQDFLRNAFQWAL
ncbi:MAG: DUF4336 domain-containing protein [Candidatus Promineifilaceae bacterium]